MTRRFAFHFLCFAALCLTCGGRAFGEAGRTGAVILQKTIGGRSAAMGRAFTAVPGGPESLLFNPAGTAFVSRPSVLIGYLKGFADDSHGFLSFSLGLGRFVVSPAVLYYNSGTIGLNLSDGTRATVIAEEDIVGILGLSFMPHENVALGAAFKFSRLELAEAASATGLHADFGILLRHPSGLRAGAACRNVGTDIKFEEAADPPPRTLRAGAAYQGELNPPNMLDRSADLVYMGYTISADYIKVHMEDGYSQAGVEIAMQTSYSPKFFLRCGYLFDREVETVTAGFGLEQGIWTLDYATGGAKAMHVKHQLTLSLKF